MFEHIKSGDLLNNKIIKEDRFLIHQNERENIEHEALTRMTNEEFIREQKEELENRKRVETVGGKEDNLSYMNKVKEFLDKKFYKK